MRSVDPRLLLAAALLAAPLQAQTIRERQVALDPEHGVAEVDAPLRRELGLFPDVEGFETARLFRQDDGTLVLEVARNEAGALVRERRRLGDPELAELRADLATRLAAQGRTRVVDQAGRSGLVLAETLLGVAAYGFAVPTAFDIDSGRGQVAAYLLTAGLTYYLPYRITRSASVSIAERNAAVWGATRGLIHGSTLGDLLAEPERPGDDHAGLRALAALASSVAETVVAYQSVDATRATEGEVAFWSAAGDFGIPYGYGLAYLAGLFDRDVESCGLGACTFDDFRWKRAGRAVAWTVSLAAPVVAHGSGLGARYTIGDARALRSFGVLGAQVALVPAWAVWGDDESDDPNKPVVAAVLAGSAAGLWVGDRVLAERSLSGGDGLLVLAGHVAGGLGALGLTYLLDSGEPADELVYMATSAAGSVAGALLTLRAVSRGSTPMRAGGARLELTPAAALLPLLPGGGGARPLRAPLLRVRF